MKFAYSMVIPFALAVVLVPCSIGFYNGQHRAEFSPSQAKKPRQCAESAVEMLSGRSECDQGMYPEVVTSRETFLDRPRSYLVCHCNSRPASRECRSVVVESVGYSKEICPLGARASLHAPDPHTSVLTCRCD